MKRVEPADQIASGAEGGSHHGGLWPLLVGSALIVLFCAVGMRHGVEVTGDGVAYLDVAEDIQAGRWFGDPHPSRSTTHYPPGLSLSLAGGASATGLSLTGTAGLLNAAAWVASLAACLRLFRQLGGQPGPYLWLLSLCLAISAGMAEIHFTVLSEPLFLAATFWCLVLVEMLVRRGSALTLALAWLLAASAFSLRYMGVALIAAAVVRILQQTQLDRPRRIAFASVMAAAVLPVLGWLLVHSSDNGGTGSHGKGFLSTTVPDVENSVAAFGGFFLGGFPPSILEEIASPVPRTGLRILLSLTAVVVIAVAGGVGVQLSKDASGRRSASLLFRRLRDSGGLAAVDLVVVYSGLVLTWRLSTGSWVLMRYWAPAAVVLLVLVAAAASRRPSSDLDAASLKRLAAAGLVLFLLTNAAHLSWILLS